MRGLQRTVAELVGSKAVCALTAMPKSSSVSASLCIHGSNRFFSSSRRMLALAMVPESQRRRRRSVGATGFCSVATPAASCEGPELEGCIESEGDKQRAQRRRMRTRGVYRHRSASRNRGNEATTTNTSTATAATTTATNTNASTRTTRPTTRTTTITSTATTTTTTSQTTGSAYDRLSQLRQSLRDGPRLSEFSSSPLTAKPSGKSQKGVRDVLIEGREAVEEGGEHGGGGETSHRDLRKRQRSIASLREIVRRTIEDFAARKAHAGDGRTLEEAMLTDTFHRRHTYLRISITERCNFRCRYCMPEEGVQLVPDDALLTSEEIVSIADKFVRAGVDKIRLTGGEPLLRRDVLPLLRSLKSLPGLRSLAITTNGLVLSEKKLQQLKEAGLDAINISLDTLDPSKFTYITRRKGFDRVVQAVDDAVRIGFDSVKVNCVVMRGFNDDEIFDFVRFVKDRDGVEVRFIEWMPFDKNQWNNETLVPYRELLEIIERDLRLEHAAQTTQSAPMPVQNQVTADTTTQTPRPLPRVRRVSPPGSQDTAKMYTIDGYKGKFGFISSMTQHFCAGCNRLRITADGNLKVCLFGEDEISLRDCLRHGFTDEEMSAIIYSIVRNKHFSLGGYESLEKLAEGPNRPMILIGG